MNTKMAKREEYQVGIQYSSPLYVPLLDHRIRILNDPILSSQRRRMVAQRTWGNHVIFFSQRNNFFENTSWPILFTSRADEDSKTQKELLCLPTLFTSHANKTKQNKNK
jgi:hypothetical protein